MLSRARSVCLTQEEERERVKHEGKLSERELQIYRCNEGGVDTQLHEKNQKRHARCQVWTEKEKPEVSFGSRRSHWDSLLDLVDDSSHFENAEAHAWLCISGTTLGQQTTAGRGSHSLENTGRALKDKPLLISKCGHKSLCLYTEVISSHLPRSLKGVPWNLLNAREWETGFHSSTKYSCSRGRPKHNHYSPRHNAQRGRK